MPDKYGNYSEEEKREISESYSKIDVYRDGIRIIKDGVKVEDKIKSTHRTTHRISVKFQKDLFSGMLHPILTNVHRDNNLTVEIRHNYINIYYRGGNLLRISEKKPGYNFFFDLEFIKANNDAKAMISILPKYVAVLDDAQAWADMMPTIKAEMDAYFVSHKKVEREFQQLVVRENNIGGIAKKTDYYICDIEYQVGNTRFDLVAAKHTGIGKYRLVFIEMKYADSALGGKSGIIDHVGKVYKYLSENNIEELKKEMHGILETKRTLKLVEGLPAQFEFTDEKPEFIFLLANHKPASNPLHKELDKLEELNILGKEKSYTDFCKQADLKLATASFFGYGLFNDCIYTLNEFKEVNKALLDIASRRKN